MMISKMKFHSKTIKNTQFHDTLILGFGINVPLLIKILQISRKTVDISPMSNIFGILNMIYQCFDAPHFIFFIKKLFAKCA